MGFDVYALKPKTDKEEHSYFRANVWYWRPLWSFVDKICKNEISQLDKDIGQFNDGNEVLTRPEYSRICDEFEEFKKRDMLSLLKYMIYLVDFMKENSIVWGVGRGSSVASYILYLIGVHRINSIQFDLDWREFLR